MNKLRDLLLLFLVRFLVWRLRMAVLGAILDFVLRGYSESDLGKEVLGNTPGSALCKASSMRGKLYAPSTVLSLQPLRLHFF